MFAGLIGTLFVVFALFVAKTDARTILTLENKIAEGKVVKPLFNIWAETKLGGKSSIFTFLQVQENWAEAYVGLAYAPFTWIQLGAGGGIEQADSPWRVGTYVRGGKGSFSLLAVGETGGGAHWYLVKALYTRRIFKTGVYIRRFTGVGPYLEVAIPNTPFSVWGVPVYNFKARASQFVIGAVCAF